MATTPECLQQRFGLAAELGTVAMPRAMHAFVGTHPRDRRDFLESFYPAVVSGAIGFEGQHKATVRGIRVGVTQAEIATHAGTRRETITRRMSKLATQTPDAAAWRRRQQALNQRRNALVQLEMHRESCQCELRGERCPTAEKLCKIADCDVPDIEAYASRCRPDAIPLFQRRRRFGMASRYGLNIGPRREMWLLIEVASGQEIKRFFSAEKASQACERLIAKARQRGSRSTYQVEAQEIAQERPQYPSIEELSDATTQPQSSHWWDKTFAKLGFSDMSRWIWDPKLRDPDTGGRLGTIERLVMACYEDKGLLDELHNADGTVSSGNGRGLLTIHQKTVAAYLGISRRTLCRCNGKWERLGVLRIVSGEPRQTPNGFRRGAMMVVYLPIRMLTETEAAFEVARMEKAKQRATSEMMAAKLRPDLLTRAIEDILEATRLHGEILSAWQGQEHCLGAFWRECARQMQTARIHPELIERLIPPRRPPPQL
ncbi:MAG TPA: helix-turn-helix domain-containing protein [Terracidiphilus sp.]|jgi:hypothetical protein